MSPLENERAMLHFARKYPDHWNSMTDDGITRSAALALEEQGLIVIIRWPNAQWQFRAVNTDLPFKIHNYS